uniref:Valine--tRNA ligase n=1 Tax=Panagrolaimus sp. ES5 TaxID=591445 RepID=A0AC34FKF9_9BILA
MADQPDSSNKTPAQLQKEAEKKAKQAAKLAKFQEKQKKLDEQKTVAKPKEAKKKDEKVKQITEYTANTKPGEKKDVSCELPSAYSPKYVECAWYEFWEKEGLFKPEYNHDLRYFAKKKDEKVKQITEYTANTKPGEKKDVTCELPSAYSPKYVESACKPNPKGTFTVAIPPPNVTGTLHLGHALATSIEDTISRYHRMKGKTV